MTAGERGTAIMLRIGRPAFFIGVALLAGAAVVEPTMRDTSANGVPPTRDDLGLLAEERANERSSLQQYLAQRDVIPTHAHALLGQPAPAFTLVDADGEARTLRDLQADGLVVVVFYQGYSCRHCVQQLFDIQRDLNCFRELDARVIAISADPVDWSRERMRQHGSFDFPVLADPDRRVARAYGVTRRDRGEDHPLHGTFVVDRSGIVRWVNVGDAPFRRNAALLLELAKLKGTRVFRDRHSKEQRE